MPLKLALCLASACAAVQAVGRRIPFAFLEDVKADFLSSYADSYQQVRQAAHPMLCLANSSFAFRLFAATMQTAESSWSAWGFARLALFF
jgi:hypothetical protein